MAQTSIILIFKIICIQFTHAASTLPTFTSTELKVSAPLGRDAELNCTVSNVNGYKVAWIDKAREVILSMQDQKVSDNPKFAIHHTSASSAEDSFILTIKDISYDDEGDFMCQVNTKVAINQVFKLSVVVSPYILDEEGSGDVSEVEGGTVVLRCKAGGVPKPTITWMKDTTWHREEDKYIRSDQKDELFGDTLRLSKLKREDGGAYLCIAKNGIQPAVSKRIIVNVKFPPEIDNPLSSQSVYLGQSANISCNVNGFPQPTVRWIRESIDNTYHNKLLTTEAERPFETDRFQSFVTWKSNTQIVATLIIKETRPQDFQMYRCIANNTQGSTVAGITLHETPPTTTSTTTTTVVIPDTSTTPVISSTNKTIIKDVGVTIDNNLYTSTMANFYLRLNDKSYNKEYNKQRGKKSHNLQNEVFSLPAFVFSSSVIHPSSIQVYLYLRIWYQMVV